MSLSKPPLQHGITFGKPQPGHHQHQCPNPACQYVWEHTDAVSSLAHFCIMCNTYQDWKLSGPGVMPNRMKWASRPDHRK